MPPDKITNKYRQQTTPIHHDELIWVVPTKTVFASGHWQGIKELSDDSFVNHLVSNKEFHPRSLMEIDPTFKQIIPYLLFKCQDRLFLMQRKSTSSEQRLKNKLTLGIGGHVRAEDFTGKTVFDWAKREFHEEVFYQGNLTITTLGALNDDTNEVGKVHLGLALLLEGDSENISIKSELKSGSLVSLHECKESYTHLESWSQMIFDSILKSSH